MILSNFSSLFKSILVHVVLIALFIWGGLTTTETKYAPKVMPNYIEAKVVERPKAKTPPKPKPAPPKQTKPKPQPKKPVKKTAPPKQSSKPPATKKTTSNSTPKKNVSKNQPTSKPTKPTKAEPKKEIPQSVEIDDDFMSELMDEEAEFEEQQQEIQRQQAEDAKEQQAQELSEVEKYAAFIRDKVTRNWSRPPSARNGMQVKLQINMIPGGEVTSVSVIESSGNSAFDRSAVNAVQTAGTFEVPRNPVIFDQYFRQFSMIFRPEDLRL